MVNHAVSSRINMERMKQVYEHVPMYRGHNLSYGKSKPINVLTSSTVQNKYPNDCPSPTKNITNVNSSGEYICRTINTPQNQQNLTYQPSSSQYLNQQQIPVQRNVAHYFNMNGQLIGYDVKKNEETPNYHYNKIINHRNIQYQPTPNEFRHSEYSRKLAIYDENNETFNELKVESNNESYENNYVYESHFNSSNYDLIGNQERNSMMDISETDDCKINQCLNSNYNLDNTQG